MFVNYTYLIKNKVNQYLNINKMLQLRCFRACVWMAGYLMIIEIVGEIIEKKKISVSSDYKQTCSIIIVFCLGCFPHMNLR